MTQQAKKKWDWALKGFAAIGFTVLSAVSIGILKEVRATYDFIKSTQQQNVYRDNILTELKQDQRETQNKNQEQDNRIIHLEAILPGGIKITSQKK